MVDHFNQQPLSIPLATRGSRSKKHHHKVRSGCTSCKLRRIKCDEGKPTCKRCLYSGRDCLYNPPKTWTFETTGASPENAINTKASNSPTSNFTTECSSATTTTDNYTLYHEGPSAGELIRFHRMKRPPRMPRQLYLAFGHTFEEGRSLDFWLYETGPTLANYGPDNGFWTITIPKWSWLSSACRNLMVATALADEQLGLYRKAASSSGLSPSAIFFYQTAVREMATERKPDILCLVIASLMGWVFETIQRNFSAARVHISASTRLLKVLQQQQQQHPPTILTKAQVEQLMHVKQVVLLSEAYSRAIFDTEHGAVADRRRLFEERSIARTIPEVKFNSLPEARDMLLERLVPQLVSCSQNDDDDYTNSNSGLARRLYIRSWHRSVRQYASRGSESNLHKRLMQILFNVAMALLPECEAGAFSYEANPLAVMHILASFERTIAEKNKVKQHDDDDIETTLKMALELVISSFADNHVRARARRLLLMVEMCH